MHATRLARSGAACTRVAQHLRATRAAHTASRAFAAERVRGFGGSVFSEFTALANKHGAYNLGQGFPDFPPPPFVSQIAADVVRSGSCSQYTRAMGHVSLTNALAKHYSPRFGRDIAPATDIVVTAGATEALMSSMLAFINPGDEVVLFEPFYDAYPAQISMVGGVPRYVPMRSTGNRGTAEDWTIDASELRKAVTPRTKAIVLNNPHNPLGKVFRADELEAIAAVAREKDLLVISDEVYDHLVFADAPNRHVRIATLPGTWERTVTVGSAGKTFSVTGWKIGWTISAPPLAHAVAMAHQWVPFCVATPLQEAVGQALAEAAARNYFEELETTMMQKRNRLLDGLRAAGAEPIVPHGGYFVVARTPAITGHVSKQPQTDPSDPADVATCKWLTTTAKVAAIPPSAFYSESHKPMAKDLARFAFCKSDEVIGGACKSLAEAVRSHVGRR